MRDKRTLVSALTPFQTPSATCWARSSDDNLKSQNLCIMKSMNDYQNEVLNEMVDAQTLVFNDGKYFVEEGVSDSEVQEALIGRYSSKMNEYLIEPYGQAMIHQKSSDDVIEQAIDQFANQIEKDCEMLCVNVPLRGCLFKHFYKALEDRFV